MTLVYGVRFPGNVGVAGGREFGSYTSSRPGHLTSDCYCRGRL